MRGGWSLRGTVLNRISHNHFSFIKGIFLGFKDVEMYQRYIEYPGSTPVDPRTIKSIRKWVIAELIRLAGRHNKNAGIRILKIDPSKLEVSSKTSESLEQFEDRMGMGRGFYTESELLEMFEEYHAGDTELRANAKKARIRQKQLDLLAFLVGQENVKPSTKDLIAGWLEPSISRHFENAGVAEIGQLVEGINAFGFNWHRKIPGIGAKAANHIVKWLSDDEVAQSLGIKIKTAALLPPALLRNEPSDRPLETAIVPFECFLVPSAMDGSNGDNLHAKAGRQANNDKEAIDLWLKSVRPGHTFRSYRKEAERFLLWSILEKGKPFSSLSLNDCISYRNFLNGLGRDTPVLWDQQFSIPQSDWMAPRSYPRRSPLWRPFEGKLSNLSQKYALGVLSTLCEFLVKIRYLDSNPFVGLTLITDAKNKINTANTLRKEDILAIKDFLKPRQKDPKYRRIQLLMLITYSTGVRMAELSQLTRGSFSTFIRGEDMAVRWQITVIGKGNKERQIELSPALMEQLEEHFFLAGLGDFTSLDEKTPLLSHLDNKDEALSHERIYTLLTDFFREVAQTVESSDPEVAKRLRNASTHWMRHTFANIALESGMALEVLRDLLGHASLATTSLYVQTERDRRSAQIDAFSDKAGF